jgi:hypothetical protein
LKGSNINSDILRPNEAAKMNNWNTYRQLKCHLNFTPVTLTHMKAITRAASVSPAAAAATWKASRFAL